jgi:hypothetical protein
MLSRALLPLMESSDAEMRLLARNASLIVRETTFAPVERAAGGRSETTLEVAHKLDASPDAAEVARAFHLPAPRNASPVATTAAAPISPLDEAFFRANIEPILQ